MNKNSLLSLIICAASLSATSCHNSEQEFADFEYSAVYFASQTPVRTLVMGEDIYNTTLDNEHKCMVYATIGGVYANTGVVKVAIEVDNSICDDLYFEDGQSKVTPLPAEYYTLASDEIVLNKSLMDGVEVQFTDAFFEDEDALKNTYVLPLKMTSASGVDKILSGTATVDNPCYFSAADWTVTPKDYVLYCVKYINKWDASYLRRGEDKITIDGGTPKSVVRKKEYVEDDQVCEVTTKSLDEAIFAVELKGSGLAGAICQMLLSFDDKDKCTITAVDKTNFKVSGTGSYVVDGEKKSWGDKDRDALYLEYTIETTIAGESVKYESDDTMVIQSRGISAETFKPQLKY